MASIHKEELVAVEKDAAESGDSVLSRISNEPHLFFLRQRSEPGQFDGANYLRGHILALPLDSPSCS